MRDVYFYWKKTGIRKKHQVTVLKEAKKELPILAAKAYNIFRLKSAKENLCGYPDIKMTILC